MFVGFGWGGVGVIAQVCLRSLNFGFVFSVVVWGFWGFCLHLWGFGVCVGVWVWVGVFVLVCYLFIGWFGVLISCFLFLFWCSLFGVLYGCVLFVVCCLFGGWGLCDLVGVW